MGTIKAMRYPAKGPNWKSFFQVQFINWFEYYIEHLLSLIGEKEAEMIATNYRIYDLNSI